LLVDGVQFILFLNQGHSLHNSLSCITGIYLIYTAWNNWSFGKFYSCFMFITLCTK